MRASGPQTVSIPVADESALPSIAALVAAALPVPAFVALRADLGGGKTTFVKAVAAAAGVDPAEVVSPTFGLVHEHRADHRRLVHADMYRLTGPADLHEIGWDEAVARADWTFVEWPERIAAALPADRLEVAITVDSPQARTFVFTSLGPRHDAVVAQLRSRIARG